MSFLSKYYKPWSLPWLLQQGFLVISQRRLLKVSVKTLWVDYHSSRKVGKSLLKRSSDHSVSQIPGVIYSKPVKIISDEKRLITCKNIVSRDLSALNHYFDQVYVINLARRTDRRDEMIRKLTRLNIKAEFFPAEDGASEENMREFTAYFTSPIDPQNAHEMETRLKRKVIVSPGAWGILKTYRKLISEAQAVGFEKILCLEDDIIFAKNFEEMFCQAMKIIPDSWKVLYFGASQHTWEEDIDLIKPQGIFKETDPVRYYFPLNTDGAFAVALKRAVFPYLLAESEGMNCPLDTGALRSASKLYKGECFVLQPNLVIADVRESDIRVNRKQKDFAEIARWDLSLYDFNDR
jgi:GR25 family glycosyltransferase involved in LPS biosynthesis